jgi:hypothetical protein
MGDPVHPHPVLNQHILIAGGSAATGSFSVGGSPHLSAVLSTVSDVDGADLVPSQGSSKKCHCRRSRCLKLYCECFAANVLCDGCKCVDCENTQYHPDSRRKAVQYKLSRNRTAFEPKFKATSAVIGQSEFSHIRGCNCKRSNCRKKYCECFQAGIECAQSCKCVDCANDGSLPHLRNFGVHNWMLPHCREAVGSVIGVESLMMILPVAEEPEPAPPPPVKKRRSNKHQRTKSYDSTTNRETVSAQQQPDLTWDDLAMASSNISAPLKTEVFDDFTRPSQRRKLDEMDSYCAVLSCSKDLELAEAPASPTPRSGDALIAGLLMSPSHDDELTPRREASADSLTTEGFVKSEALPPRLGCDLLSPCRGELDLGHSELMDLLNDGNRTIWGPALGSSTVC